MIARGRWRLRAIQGVVTVGLMTMFATGIALVAHYAGGRHECSTRCEQHSWTHLPISTIILVGVAVGVAGWLLIVAVDIVLSRTGVLERLARSIRRARGMDRPRGRRWDE